jgi:hypothetical protein
MIKKIPLAGDLGVAGRIVHYYKKNEQVRPWEGIRKVSFVYA